MFYWRDVTSAADGSRGGLIRGFTSRSGGSSPAPFDSLNLGGHVGDDPGVVERNRAAVAGSLGLIRERLLFMNQCHGSDVVAVERPWAGEPPRADALVTASPAIGLAVLVADCVPVLLADTAAGVVGALHAGRRGLCSRIVERTVAAMGDLGARSVLATVGPSICGRCYEVPQQMRDDAAAVSPVSATLSWDGTPAIDVAAGVVDQLRSHGVSVQWVPGCTRESPLLFSHRRQHRTGRFAGVIRLVGTPP